MDLTHIPDFKKFAKAQQKVLSEHYGIELKLGATYNLVARSIIGQDFNTYKALFEDWQENYNAIESLVKSGQKFDFQTVHEGKKLGAWLKKQLEHAEKGLIGGDKQTYLMLLKMTMGNQYRKNNPEINIVDVDDSIDELKRNFRNFKTKENEALVFKYEPKNEEYNLLPLYQKDFVQVGLTSLENYKELNNVIDIPLYNEKNNLRDIEQLQSDVISHFGKFGLEPVKNELTQYEVKATLATDNVDVIKKHNAVGDKYESMTFTIETQHYKLESMVYPKKDYDKEDATIFTLKNVRGTSKQYQENNKFALENAFELLEDALPKKKCIEVKKSVEQMYAKINKQRMNKKEGVCSFYNHMFNVTLDYIFPGIVDAMYQAKYDFIATYKYKVYRKNEISSLFEDSMGDYKDGTYSGTVTVEAKPLLHSIYVEQLDRT